MLSVIRNCFCRKTFITVLNRKYNCRIEVHQTNTIRHFLCDTRKDTKTNWLRISHQFKQHIYTTCVIEKRRKTAEERKSPKIIEYPPKKSNKTTFHGTIDVWRNITVQELAIAANRDLEDIQEVMLYIPNTNDLDPQSKIEDFKVLREIVNKLGLKTRITAPPTDKTKENKDRDITPRPPATIENLLPRPPVVTVMGHVDHGKTTLLDSLRGASVAANEAGGITQHIGAFTVILENGEKVTFLDTPGHAAFSSMRARGAGLTDIIVLVVAADDGVMEQTKEVINLANKESVPIIVAINKIDKPEANIDRVKKELIQMGIALEGCGGDVQSVNISALQGTNLEYLAEAISAQATLMGLKSEYIGPVEGIVVESKTDRQRGKLSTAIITRGTLRKGCILVSGLAWAKVRAMFDHSGTPIDAASPGMPVEIIGWRELPLSGEIILEVDSEHKAHSVLRYRESQASLDKALADRDVIMQKEQEHLIKYRAEREARRKAGRYRMRREGPRTKQYATDDKVPRINLIIKADVHGSAEAILDVLETYCSNDKCRLDIVHYGVGAVTEGDIDLAKAFNAIIYAFSVKSLITPPKNIILREFNIIYRLIDDLKLEINKKLPSIEVEEEIGTADVIKQFFITENRKEIPIAGCRCVKGVLKKALKFKLIRNDEIIYNGTLESLRHIKNEVESIKKDVECGLRFKDAKVIPEVGDKILCYTTHQQAQVTDWDPGF